MRCHSGFARRSRAILLLALGVCLLSVRTEVLSAEGEETSVALREMAEAKVEDAADRARGEGYVSEKTFAGRLTLGPVMEGRNDVVGLFSIEKGKSYPIKLEDERLLKDLKEYDRKTVSLQGKFRNQGQYFVVTAIIPPPAPAATVLKIGGL